MDEAIWRKKYSTLESTNETLEVLPFGFGPTGQLMAGIEYYPIPLFGFFIEGGAQGLIGLHRLEKITRVTQSLPGGGSNTSSHTQDTWSFDAYWLSSWQLQFGL